jgi:plastocyanin
MPRRSLALLVVCLALPLSIAACGDDEDDDGAAQTGTATNAQGGVGSTLAVSETEYRLDPANPAVQAGTVTIETAHHPRARGGGAGGESETEDIAPGDSAELTVDLSQAGTYEWYCPIGNHKELGMEGEIRVADASGAAPPVDDSGGDSGEDSSGTGASPYSY